MSISASSTTSLIPFPAELESHFPCPSLDERLQVLSTNQSLVNLFLKTLETHQEWLKEHPKFVRKWMSRISSPSIAYKLFSAVKTNQLLRNVFDECLLKNPFSPVWFRYHYSPPRTIIKATNSNFAHLLSDSYMKRARDNNGERLEGGAFHQSTLFVLAILEELRSDPQFFAQFEPFFSLVVPILKNAGRLSMGVMQTISRSFPRTDELINSQGDLPYTKEKSFQLLRKIAHDLKPVVNKIVNQIRELKEGQSILIPFEYQNYPGGHVMLLEVSRNLNHLFQMAIFNTGEGLEYHTSILEVNKRRYFPAVLYLGIEESAITNVVFWQTLLEPLYVRFILKTATPYSSKDFYEAIFSRFADKRVDDFSTIKGFRTPQRSGSCSMRVIFAYLRLKLGETDYKKLKLHILYKSICILFSDPEALRKNSTRRWILSNGIASLSRFALKSYLNIRSEFDLDKIVRLAHHVESFLHSIENEKFALIPPQKEMWRLENHKQSWSMRLFDYCYQIRENQQTFKEEMKAGIHARKKVNFPFSHPPYQPFPLPDEVSILSSQVFENYLNGIADLAHLLDFSGQQLEKGLLTLKFVDLAILRLPFPSQIDDHSTIWSQVDPTECLSAIYRIFAKLIVERQDSSISFFTSEIIVLEKLLALAHFLACRLDDCRDISGIDRPIYLKNFKVQRHFLSGVMTSPAQSFQQTELEEVYDALIDYYEDLNHGREVPFLWQYEQFYQYLFGDYSAERHYLFQFVNKIPPDLLIALDQFAMGIKNWREIFNSKGFYPMIQILWAGRVEGCPIDLQEYLKLVPDHFRTLVNMSLMVTYRQQGAQKSITSNFLRYNRNINESLVTLRFEKVGRELEAKYSYSKTHKKPGYIETPHYLSSFYAKDYSKLVSIPWTSIEYERLFKIYAENPLTDIEILNSFYLAPEWNRLIKSSVAFWNFIVDTSNFPSLRLQRVKNILESPLFDLNDSDLQQISLLLLFSYGAVQEVVTQEPTFAFQFLRVVRCQIQRYRWMIEDKLLSAKPSKDLLGWIKTFTFLHLLKIHFLEKLKSTPITKEVWLSEAAIDKKISHERRKFLKFLNSLKRLSTKSRNEFSISYVAMFLVGPSPSDEELLGLYSRYALMIPFKDHLPSDFFEKHDEYLFHNFLNVIAMHSYRFANLMDRKPDWRDKFIARLFKKKHAMVVRDKISWNGSFPYYDAKWGRDLYTVDMLEWKFQKNGLPFDDVSEIYHYKSYQFLFGKNRLDSVDVVAFPNRYSPDTNGIYCSAIAAGGRSVSFSKLGNYFTITCLLDGLRYEFVPWESVPLDLPPLELQPNFLHYEVWASLDGDAHLRIVERQSKVSVCFVYLDGTLNFPFKSKKTLFYSLQLPEEGRHHPLLNLDHPFFILALKAVSPTPSFHSSIQFQRYFTPQGEKLQFVLKEPFPGKEIVQWSNCPGYFVDEDQSLLYLDALQRYVVVKNSLGNRRLITSLTPDISEDIDQVEERYELPVITIDLDEKGRLAPGSQKERVFAAYLSLLNRDYHAAFSFLYDLYHHTKYSDEIFQILGWILHSCNEVSDYHPNALAVRVYAGWLGVDNLFRNQHQDVHNEGDDTAPLQELKASPRLWKCYWENKVPFGHVCLISTLTDLYLAYLDLRNGVDSLLQFDSELGREESDPLALKRKWALFEEMFFLKTLMKYDSDGRIKMRYTALVSKQEMTFGPFLEKKSTFREPQLNTINLGFATPSYVLSLQSLRNLYPRTRPEKVSENFIQGEFPQILHLLLHAPETRKEVRELLNDMTFDEPIADHVDFLKCMAQEGEEGTQIRSLVDRYLLLNEKNGGKWSAESQEIRNRIDRLISGKGKESFFNFTLREREDGGDISLKRFEASSFCPTDNLPLSITPVEECRTLPTYIKTHFPSHSTSMLPLDIPSSDPFILRKYKELCGELEIGKAQNDLMEHFVFPDGSFGEGFYVETANRLEQIRLRTLSLRTEIEELARQLPPHDQKAVRTKIELERSGKKRALPSFEECLKAFIFRSTEEYHRINPFLKAEEIHHLHQLIGDYLTFSIEMDCLKRQLEKIKMGDWESLGQLLEEKQAYDPSLYPSFLVFEYFMGLRLRPDQVADIEKMLPIQGVPSDCIVQKIMGAGKTLVLGTLLSFLKADGYHLSVMVPPSSLFHTHLLDTKDRAGRLFGQRTRTINLSRAPEHLQPSYLRYVRDTIFETIRNKEVLVVPPEVLHAIRNLYHTFHYDLMLSPQSFDMIAPCLQDLKVILNLFKSRGVFTFDEVHLVLETTKEYNFSVGESTAIDEDELSIVKWLYSTLAIDLEVPFEQCGSSAETFLRYEKIRSSFATLTVDYLLNSSYWRKLLHLKHAHRDILIEYFSNPFHSTPSFIHELYEKGFHRAADLLVFIFLELTLWIPASCKASIHAEYGFVNGKRNAVPCTANRRPSKEAEFRHSTEMMNRTFQLFLYTGMSKEETLRFIRLQKLKQRQEYEYELGKIPIELVPSAKKFAQAFQLDLFSFPETNKQAVEGIRKKMMERNGVTIHYLLDFAADEVLRKVKIYKEQLHGNAHHLSALPKVRQGYSGSMECKERLPLEPHLEHGTTGKILDITLSQNTVVHVVNSFSVEEVLEEILSDNHLQVNPSVSRFRALIDSGPFFKGVDSYQAAKEILRFHQKHPDRGVKAVLYWDDETELLCCLKEGKESHPIILEKTSPEAIFSTIELGINDYFVYFPHHKLTGANIPLPDDARALATVSENTPLRDLFQGDFRMRNLRKQQRVERVVQSSIVPLIRDKVGGDSLSITTIVLYTFFNQVEKEKNTLLCSIIQELEAVAEDFVDQLMLSEESFSLEHEYFKRAASFFVKKLEPSYYLRYALDQSHQPMETFLIKKVDELKGALRQIGGNFPTEQAENELMHKWELIMEKARRHLGAATIDLAYLNGAVGRVAEQMQEQKSDEKTSSCVVVDTASESNERSCKWHFTIPWHEPNFEFLDFQVDATKGLYRNAPRFYRMNTLEGERVDWAPDFLYASENFLFTEKNTINLFDQIGKNVREVLACYSPGQPVGGNPWRIVLLSTYDTTFLKELLLSSASGMENMILLEPNLDIVQQGVLKLGSMERRDIELLRDALVPVLFFNGEIKRLTSRGWLRRLKMWLAEGRQEKRVLFEKYILRRSSVEMRLYEGSLLQKILNQENFTF